MEDLRKTVKYNPEEGTFFKMTYGVMKPFGIKSKGTLKIEGKPYNAAKLAWWFVHGVYPDGRGVFGYKDGNSLNWKISNLVPLFDIDNGELTQNRLKELFDYDSETGNLIRKYTMGGQKPGIADTMREDGYLRVSIFGKRYQSHRIVWLWNTGSFPKYEIDHINHDKADNRMENLRDVPTSENSKNMPSYSNRELPMGVYLRKAGTNRLTRDRYEAILSFENKRHHIGTYNTAHEANIAVTAVRTYLGFHDNHGSTS